MDTIASSHLHIAKLVEDADRIDLERLKDQLAAIDKAAKVAISLGSLSGETLTHAAETAHTTRQLIRHREAELLAKQTALIAEVPYYIEDRANLMPVKTAAELEKAMVEAIEALRDMITDGESLEVLVDGIFKTGVTENDVHVINGATSGLRQLSIDGVGDFVLDHVEAMHAVKGLTILTWEGVVVQIKPMI